MNDKINERIINELPKLFSEKEITNQKVIQQAIEKIKSENMIQVARENGLLLKQAFDRLIYEAIINKQQY